MIKYIISILVLITFFLLLLYSFIPPKVIIPYTDERGQPNKKTIELTISLLEKIQRLKTIFIKEKLYLGKKNYIQGKEIFTEKILEKYNLDIKEFNYNYNGKTYNLFDTYNHMEIYISNNPTEYILFSMHYPNSNHNKTGLYMSYGLFYDNRETVELKSEDYQKVIKLEKNWYLFVKTEVYVDADIWSYGIESTNEEYIWDGTPPVEYVIRPYNNKEIEK